MPIKVDSRLYFNYFVFCLVWNKLVFKNQKCFHSFRLTFCDLKCLIVCPSALQPMFIFSASKALNLRIWSTKRASKALRDLQALPALRALPALQALRALPSLQALRARPIDSTHSTRNWFNSWRSHTLDIQSIPVLPHFGAPSEGFERNTTTTFAFDWTQNRAKSKTLSSSRHRKHTIGHSIIDRHKQLKADNKSKSTSTSTQPKSTDYQHITSAPDRRKQLKPQTTDHSSQSGLSFQIFLNKALL